MHEWLSDRSAGRRIPQASASIITAGKQNAAIGAEGLRSDRTVMFHENTGTGRKARQCVPKPSAVIQGCRGDHASIGTESNGGYFSLMLKRRTDGLARLSIPQAGSSIRAGRQNFLTFRAEGNTGDRASMSQGRADWLTSFDIPQARRAIRSSKDNSSPIRA